MKNNKCSWKRCLTLLSVVCGFLIIINSVAQAEEVTARTLIDRQQIEDLITRYYYNFGKENRDSFTDFYAEDAELILGETHFKGRDGIEKAYGGGSGEQPRREPPKRYAFNVTISNPLIVVHGDKATSQVIFTEYVIENRGDPVKMTTQGKEFATFTKVKGQWKYQTRQIAGASSPPEGWKE